MAKLNHILTSKLHIGMDTSPLIYYFERHPSYFPLVQEIVEYTENTPAAILITSALTLLETIVSHCVTTGKIWCHNIGWF